MINSSQMMLALWWGKTIALATVDNDEESIQQLENATGMSGEDFWKSMRGMNMTPEFDSPEDGWTQTLARFAHDPDSVDNHRPMTGDPNYDPALATITECLMRLVRGAAAGNPACLPN